MTKTPEDGAATELGNMDHPSRRSWYLATLIAFGAGVLLGFAAETRPKAAGSTPGATREDERTSPRPEAQPESVTTATSLVDVSPMDRSRKNPGHLALLETLCELNLGLQRKLNVPLLLVEELNDDFVRLYGLTSSEASRLRRAIATVRQKLNELETHKAIIEKTGDGRFSISIPDSPIEGGATYDEFIRSIRETLGPERLAYYDQLSPYDFERSSVFGQFGLCKSAIHIKPMRDENGKPTARTTLTADRGDGVWHQDAEIDPVLFPSRYPHLYQKMLDGGFVTATP